MRAAPAAGRLLSVQGLALSHRSGAGWTRALDGVHLDVGRGEAVGLVGPSGCGKSTLALAVMGWRAPGSRVDGGRILFEGVDILALPEATLRGLRGGRIALVAQNPAAALNPVQSIGHQVAEAVRTGGRAARRARAVHLLEQVGLPEPARVATRHPHELSGGMQQRAAIAMALANDPDLLVLDEPTVALDMLAQAGILALLRDLRASRRLSLLFISHALPVVASLCERIAVMEAGAVVETGAPQAVLSQPRSATGRALRAAALDPDAAPAPAPIPDPRDGTPPVLLSLEGVSCRLGGVEILHAVDLSIGRGEAVAVVGESGSGKSTLARVVVGLAAPSAGRLSFEGEALAGRVERRTTDQRRAVQMVFQAAALSLNPVWTIGRAVARAARLLTGAGRAEARASARDLLARVGLPPALAAVRPGRLSGGQAQRVAVARALAGQPRLLVLDEPTSALDTIAQARVLDLIDALRAETGAALLLVTHDLAVVRRVADHVFVLYRGWIVEEGPAAAVFAPPWHPYTKALIEAVPRMGGPPASDSGRVTGDDAPMGYAAGAAACVFAPRCPAATATCRTVAPPWAEPAPGHRIRCWTPVAVDASVCRPSGRSTFDCD
ncbi:MAG TPA: ABC transporter ATP-binding protein [Azospirillaceae bacterium]|nr:ABC transporter ATP-binding protein [Azospirillaceae bacterium]